MTAPGIRVTGVTIGGGVNIRGTETPSSFILSSGDFTQVWFNGGYVAPVGPNLGFAIGGSTGSGQAIYVARLSTSEGGNPTKSAELAAYWTTHGWNLTDTVSRIFDVSWGAGSSQPTGKVILGLYYNNSADCNLNIGTVYTGNTDWQTPGQNIFTGPPMLEAGTFMFPATFTLHTPIITDNNNWC